MERDIGLSEAEHVIDETIEKYREYVNPTLANLMRFAGFGDIEATALGTVVTDYSGNQYIDCLGGYGVFSLGHRHPEVVSAVREQLECMPLSSKIFFNKPLADLAELRRFLEGELARHGAFYITKSMGMFVASRT